jgi:hypothetical protein
VPVTPRDSAKSSVRSVSVTTKSVSSAAKPTDGPTQIVHQHDRGRNVKAVCNKQQEAQQSGRTNKNVGEDDANDNGVHSGKW